MKWLAFFRTKRKKLACHDGSPDQSSEEQSSDQDQDQHNAELTHKRRNSALLTSKHDSRLSRPSLDQWFEARRARTSIDVDRTTTTDKLTVCKAGVTTLINRTYVVIKHLGSGTYGQVKLAFNLKDHKLYAIKFCRKSQYGAAQGAAPCASPRSGGLGRLRRSMTGANAAAAAARAVAAHMQGQQGAGFAGVQQQQQGSWGRFPSGGGAPPASSPAPASISNTSMPPPSSVPPVTNIVLHPPPSIDATGPVGPGSQLQQQPALASSDGREGMVTEHASRQPPLAATQQQQQPQQGLGSGGFAGTAMPLMQQGGGASSSMQGISGPAEAPGPPASAGAGGGGGGVVGAMRVSVPGGFGARPYVSSSSGAGGVGTGQVGERRLGPGSMPRYRYSSAVAGMGMPPPPAQPRSSLSPEGLDTVPDAEPAYTGIAPAGAPPVFRKRPQAGEDSADGRGAAPYQRASARAEDWVREIAIMKKLSHPNIVRLVEVIDDPGSDNVLLVMEYVEGISLHPQRIDSSTWHAVPEHEAWRRTRDVLQGLDYLHYHGVVHGDLKPANLMLDSNSRQVKIVDFGSAVISQPGGAPGSFMSFMGGTSMSCTPAFRSPESLKAAYRPSFELDMWALGVTVYMWVFGELPFNGAAPFLIYECIRRKDLVIPEDADISCELRDFLHQVLHKDSTQRLDVVGALNHAWVTGSGTAPLPFIQRGSDTSAGSCLDSDAVVLVGQQANRADGAAAAASGNHKRHRYGQARILSQDELDKAISHSLGGHAISELMGMLFEEVRVPAKQQFIHAGDPVNTIYLITQGEVEIYQELPPEEAAAAAVLLGATNKDRSRILATVLGPTSEHGTQAERAAAAAAANLSGTLDKLQLAGGSTGGGLSTPEPMVVDSRPSSQNAMEAEVTYGRQASMGGAGLAPGGALASSLGSGGSFGKWVASALGRTSGEFKAPQQPPASGTGVVYSSSNLGAAPVAAAVASMDMDVAQQRAAAGPNSPRPMSKLALGSGVGASGGLQPPRVPPTSHTAIHAPPSAVCLSAAATSLSQPIISGLKTGHSRQLFCGPHIKGYQKALIDGGSAGALEEEDEEEDTEDDRFLDNLVGSVGGLLAGALSSQEGRSEGDASSGQLSGLHRKQLLFRQGSGSRMSGQLGEPSSSNVPPVVILAVKGPGDTLGFASLEPCKSRAGSAAATGSGPAGGQGVASGAAESQQVARCTEAGPCGGSGGGQQVLAGVPCSCRGREEMVSVGTAIGSLGSSGGPHSRGVSSAHALPTQEMEVIEPCMLSADTAETGSTSVLPPQAGHKPQSDVGGVQAVSPAHTLQPQTPCLAQGAAAMEVSMQEQVETAVQAGLQQGSQQQQQQGQQGHAVGRPTWRAHVRARGEVVAFKADIENMQRLSKEHPELEAALKHMAVQQETDLLVSEALRQLRLVSAGLSHPASPAEGPSVGSPGSQQKQPAGAQRQGPGNTGLFGLGLSPLGVGGSAQTQAHAAAGRPMLQQQAVQ